MGFTQAHSAEEDDVGFLFDEAELEKMLDLGRVDFLGPTPVEVVEGFDDREAGGVDAPFGGMVPSSQGFAFDEAGQIFEMAPVFCGSLLGQGFAVFPQEGKLQVFELVVEWGAWVFHDGGGSGV